MNLNITIPAIINGQIKLPSSKSISNRMLLINELAQGSIMLKNISNCDDTFVMQRALNNLQEITDIKAAGTAMRFLTAYYATSSHTTTLTGTHRMKQRPIHILVDALRMLGADIEYVENEGFPPLRIRGRKLEGGEVSLPGNVSSQYVSALLMVAPTLSGGLTLRLKGRVISRPYIDITLALMRQFGIQIDELDSNTFVVHPGSYTYGVYTIENDWSAASYWYEMMSLAKEGRVELEGLYADSLQGDSCIQRLFEPLGVQTTFTESGAVLTKTRDVTNFYEADLTSCPDLAQTLVVTCCMKDIPFRFSGLHSLRIKETNRLLALRQELRKTGYIVGEEDESILYWENETCAPDIIPTIETYEDHRMAMSMAPCAIRFNPVFIREAHVVSKSYPTFWEDLASIGANVIAFR